MTVVEKAAYLRGLAEGSGCMNDKGTAKVWEALCELMTDLAHEVEDLQMNSIDLAEALNDVTESVNELEELTADFDLATDYWSDDEDDFEDEFDDEDDEIFDEDDDEPLDFEDIIYDAVCPSCGAELSFTEADTVEGYMHCPGCGERLEFDLGSSDEELPF